LILEGLRSSGGKNNPIGGIALHAKRLVHDLDMGSFWSRDKCRIIAVPDTFI